MKVLSVSSGKGGVGKSTFSLNIARQLSLNGKKTLLVDFDIHNQGLTSLFLARIAAPPAETGAAAPTLTLLDLLNATGNFRHPPLTSAITDLRFVPLTGDALLHLLPTSLPRQTVDWARFHSPNPLIIECFLSFFAQVAKIHSFDVVVIDCYGGIDSMTIAAAGIADDTILVNEPDLITFTGTLKLYKCLAEQYQDSPRRPRIHFVINRITSRHSYAFLSDTYKESLVEYSVDSRILAYFPYDRLLMESFGDYPFFTEILPRSLFSRKLRLLIATLWPNDPAFAGFSKLQGKKREKVFSQTAEYSFAEPDRIIRAFVRVPFLLIIPALLLLLIGFGVGGSLNYMVILAASYVALPVLAGLVVFFGFFEPLQITRWLFREARYRQRKAALKRIGNNSAPSSISPLDFAQALTPGILGSLFLAYLAFALIVSAFSQISDRKSILLRPLAFWPHHITGFRPGHDYSGIVLHEDATFGASPDYFHPPAQKADLRGASFQNAELSSVAVVSADLSGANFEHVFFYKSAFLNVDLKNADLRGGYFFSSVFRNTNLNGANLRDADLSQAKFSDFTDLRGAQLQDAEVNDVEGLHTAYLQGADFRTTHESVGVKVPMSDEDMYDAEICGARTDVEKRDAATQLKGLAKAFKDHLDVRQSDIPYCPREIGLQVLKSRLKSLSVPNTREYQDLIMALDLEVKVIAGQPALQAAVAWRDWLIKNKPVLGLDSANSLAFYGSEEDSGKECDNPKLYQLDAIDSAARGTRTPNQFYEDFVKASACLNQVGMR